MQGLDVKIEISRFAGGVVNLSRVFSNCWSLIRARFSTDGFMIKRCPNSLRSRMFLTKKKRHSWLSFYHPV